MITPFVPPSLDAGTLVHAVALVRSGFQLVLLHAPLVGGGCSCANPECSVGGSKESSRGKHPIRGSWQKNPIRDETQLQDEFRRCKIKSEPNLGIVLGLQPLGAYVIAIDVDDATRLKILEDELGPLPETLEGRSARGARLFFTVADPPKEFQNRTGLGGESGVDVKVKGGQVVVAPSLHGSGVRYTWTRWPEKLAELPSAWVLRIAEPRKVEAPSVGYRSTSKIEKSTRERAQAYLDTCDPSVQGQNGSARLMRAATCMVRGFELDERSALDLLANGFNSRCQPPWSLKELQYKVAQAAELGDMEWGALKNAPKKEKSNGKITPQEIAGRITDTGVTFDQTDLRNAERLVEWFGQDLRYCSTWDKWLAWDGTRWIVDDLGRAVYCAKETARRLLRAALDAQSEASKALARAAEVESADQKESAKRALAKAGREIAHAIQSQSASRLFAMLKVAQSDSAISVHHDKLDSNPWLLNAKSWTINLKTGECKRPDRADLITRLAPVECDPSAKAPQWESFLLYAMGGDQNLVNFLQRVVGYALTGDVREHMVVFFWGNGGNGKSTFSTAILTMLGDYASSAPRGLLFRSKGGGDRHPTELSSLHGRRFVLCSEIEEGLAFEESLVKDLTGDDPIVCRRMREDFWSYQPTHKLFLYGNHKPVVRGDDNGIWRRLRLVPWNVTVPQSARDKELKEKLRAELPGILAWAVRGCLEWQRTGIGEPDVVDKATEEYRNESDTLGQWLRDHVQFENDAKISRASIRKAYESYCEEIGTPPLHARRFAGRLRERGVTETTQKIPWQTVSDKGVVATTKVVDAWRGVRLKTDLERENESK